MVPLRRFENLSQAGVKQTLELKLLIAMVRKLCINGECCIVGLSNMGGKKIAETAYREVGKF